MHNGEEVTLKGLLELFFVFNQYRFFLVCVCCSVVFSIHQSLYGLDCITHEAGWWAGSGRLVGKVRQVGGV